MPTAACTTCRVPIHTSGRNEDGSPYFEGSKCPECGAFLCAAGICEHLSFRCECGERFCNEHAIAIPDGTERPLLLCPDCAADCDDAPFCELPQLKPVTLEVVYPNVPEFANPVEVA